MQVRIVRVTVDCRAVMVQDEEGVMRIVAVGSSSVIDRSCAMFSTVALIAVH